MPDCDRKTAYSSLRTTYFLRPIPFGPSSSVPPMGLSQLLEAQVVFGRMREARALHDSLWPGGGGAAQLLAADVRLGWADAVGLMSPQ